MLHQWQRIAYDFLRCPDPGHSSGLRLSAGFDQRAPNLGQHSPAAKYMQLSFHEVRGSGRVSAMNEQILSCTYIQILIYIYSHPYFFFQSLIFVRSNKSGKGNGGAIRTEIKTNINIENSRFMANQADAHGGAIYNKGMLDLHNITFGDNAATMVSVVWWWCVVCVREIYVGSFTLDFHIGSTAPLLHFHSCT